ncbi:hypothetical protein AB0A01_004750 [Escherichia coli]
MNYNTFKNKYHSENSDCAAYFVDSFDKFDYLNERKNEEDKIKVNTDLNVDYLADYFQKLYLNSLINERLFAKQSNFSELVFDYYEVNAFKKHFKKYFKTIKQYRKTKDILSDAFTFRAPDLMGYLHTFYFCVDKKEFDKEGNNYLEDLQLFLSEEIEKQLEKIEKEKEKEREEIEKLKLKYEKV